MQQQSTEMSEMELEPMETLADDKRMGFLFSLIAHSTPISTAVFHQAVNDSNNTPQQFFSETSDKKERKAEMWYSHAGLICKHKKLKGKDEYGYIIVPHANVIFAHVKM